MNLKRESSNPYTTGKEKPGSISGRFHVYPQ
jgi:hypothetical protein